MQRVCCTFVVLSGSARRPPRRSVESSNIASSTTKRSEPSGNRTPLASGTCQSSSPIVDADLAKQKSLWR